jgi:predicted metalloprotease
MSLKVKIGVAIIIIILIVVSIEYYNVKPMALLEGKSPFQTEDEKNKLRMEELIESIHAAQGIKV